MTESRFQLPAAEDDLWHQVVVRLLEQRDSSEELAHDQLRLLEELAFHSRLCGKPLTRAFVEDTATWLAEELRFSGPRQQALSWLEDLEQWELLSLHGEGAGGYYEFAISTLDEYFAARHWAGRWAEENRRFERWLLGSASVFPWKRGLNCPNPKCGGTLPPFRTLLQNPESEEVILMGVGLVQTAEREAALLNQLAGTWFPFFGLDPKISHAGGCLSVLLLASFVWKHLPFLLAYMVAAVRPVGAVIGTVIGFVILPIVALMGFILFLTAYLAGGLLVKFLPQPAEGFVQRDCQGLSRKWKALSRCRQAHPDIVQDMTAVTFRGLASTAGRFQKGPIDEGLLAVTAARVLENFDPLFRGCMQALDEKRDWAVCGAIIALGSMRLQEAVQPLIQKLWDHHDFTGLFSMHELDIQINAAYALGKIGDVRAIEPLILVLESRDSLSKFAAIALGLIGDSRAVEPLLASLQAKDHGVREFAAGALEPFDDPRIVPALRLLLDDPDAGVRKIARAVINRMQTLTIPARTESLE